MQSPRPERPDERLPHNAIARSAEAGRSFRAGGVRPGRRRIKSAADGAGLERLGFCIAGLKQPSDSRGETTEAVALQ
jgi:hypothetical protein